MAAETQLPNRRRALRQLRQLRQLRLKLGALIVAAAGIERTLTWLGEPSALPTLSPARGPPFFKSVVNRRKLGELPQAELFDTAGEI